MYRSKLASLLLVSSLAAAPILVGCDKDAAKPGDKVLNQQDKTTTDPNGNQTTHDQKTVQHSDGTVTTEKHTDTQHPNP
jgi:hypothetical protein